MEVKFVPYYFEERLSKPFLDKVLKKVSEYEKLAIVYIIQNKKQAEQLFSFLKKHKKTIMAGQVLGCNVENVKNNKADVFLLLGSGKFHAIEIKRNTGKPVYLLDSKNIEEISEREIMKHEAIKTKFLIDFEIAKNIGLLVSTKKGQFNLENALKTKKILEKKGKKSYVFLFETLIPEELVNFDTIDFWINFACPRIRDDYERFSKPVLNWKDINQ